MKVTYILVFSGAEKDLSKMKMLLHDYSDITVLTSDKY